MIEINPSKSLVHRYLICSALCAENTDLYVGEVSLDIQATIRCLKALGADFSIKSGIAKVTPINNLCNNATLDCGESGSTLRFLIPVAAALGVKSKFCGAETLFSRPIIPMFDSMMRGERLYGGEYELFSDISSQFASGLLLALPLTGRESTITLSGKVESAPYINMTVDVMKKFGVDFTEMSRNVYKIGDNQTYKSPIYSNIEGDWSNAAFWLALGAVKDSIICSHLNINSLQGDKVIIQLLNEFGAKVTVSDDNTVSVCKSELCGIDIDASDIPDLVTVLSVLGSVAHGITNIYNIHRLRYKESDRIKSIYEMLTVLGADISVGENRMTIRGKTKLRGGTVNSNNDHRIVMAAVLAAAVCDDIVTIIDSQSIKKSYPDFFERLGNHVVNIRI